MASASEEVQGVTEEHYQRRDEDEEARQVVRPRSFDLAGQFETAHRPTGAP